MCGSGSPAAAARDLPALPQALQTAAQAPAASPKSQAARGRPSARRLRRRQRAPARWQRPESYIAAACHALRSGSPVSAPGLLFAAGAPKQLRRAPPSPPKSRPAGRRSPGGDGGAAHT
eukprot:scaffold2643_cov117-Isochrysis_galbana.AAC.9